MEFIVTVRIDARIQVEAKSREQAIELIENATYVECDSGGSRPSFLEKSPPGSSAL